jgi:hypothetical protein
VIDALGALLFASVTLAGGNLLSDMTRWRRALALPVGRFVMLLGPATAIYAAAVIYRGVRYWILFDRYFILVVPLLIVPVLWQFQEAFGSRLPKWGWWIVGLLGCFGVALTHDYLASERARLAAATAVTATGVPRTEVSAGLEYDGWTELEAVGRIREPQELAALPAAHDPLSPPYWFWSLTRSITPVYILTYSRLPALDDTSFPAIRYTTWLPPFQHAVLTQKAPSPVRR